MDCAFCDIVAEGGDAYEVYRDEDTVAFLDAYPAAEGHTLVVPTDHRDGLADLTAGETANLFRTVQEVATALESSLDADGVSVFQSSGAAAGQDVFHVHVHVIPRFEGDDIRFAPPRNELGDRTGRTVARQVQDAL